MAKDRVITIEEIEKNPEGCLDKAPHWGTKVSKLVLLTHNKEEGGLGLLLIKRGEKVYWPGHWSFPGGHQKHGETNIRTATREAASELGKRDVKLAVLGTLKPVFSIEGHEITPVVAMIDDTNFSIKSLKPKRREVAEIRVIPIEQIFNKSAYRRTDFRQNNVSGREKAKKKKFAGDGRFYQVEHLDLGHGIEGYDVELSFINATIVRELAECFEWDINLLRDTINQRSSGKLAPLKLHPPTEIDSPEPKDSGEVNKRKCWVAVHFDTIDPRGRSHTR